MFDVSNLIQSGGLLLVCAMIFAESGMFIGFFFPGDTLLLSAGIFASQGKLELATLLPAVAFAAILGDNIGYIIGDRYGRKLFDKPDSIIFKKAYIEQAEAFFEKYGNKAMALAHFVPVVRTFAPAAAGIAEMPRIQFIIFDAIGDTAWAIGITLIGYYFGSRIPNIDHYILIVVAVVVLAVLGPTVFKFTQALRQKKKRTATLPPATKKR